jgi:leucine dehydrogenase
MQEKIKNFRDLNIWQKGMKYGIMRSILKRKISRFISAFIILTFSSSLIVPPSYAQSLPVSLPVPGAMVPLSPGFTPALIKGIKVHPENPLEFDFIVDTGDSNLAGEELKEESKKLIKYFLASLTTPEEELWVNLSPYEEGRIIPNKLGATELGRDLLAQDYLLKQLTASLIYPEDELGKKFWDRVKKLSYERYGTTDIPMETFNKVWIVPEEAVVYENGDVAFVVKSKLKVMMEEDYIAAKANGSSVVSIPSSVEGRNTKSSPVVGIPSSVEERNTDDGIRNTNTEILKELIIPEIEKEINEGKNFALLRQIYHSVILSGWFKTRLKESLVGQVYANQNKTQGINLDDPTIKEKIYAQYLEAYKKGVYNYIKEDEEYFASTTRTVPRKYFSGGAVMTVLGPGPDSAMSAAVTLQTVTDLGMVSAPEITSQRGRTVLVPAYLAEQGTGEENAVPAILAAQGPVGSDAAMAAVATDLSLVKGRLEYNLRVKGLWREREQGWVREFRRRGMLDSDIEREVYLRNFEEDVRAVEKRETNEYPRVFLPGKFRRIFEEQRISNHYLYDIFVFLKLFGYQAQNLVPESVSEDILRVIFGLPQDRIASTLVRLTRQVAGGQIQPETLTDRQLFEALIMDATKSSDLAMLSQDERRRLTSMSDDELLGIQIRLEELQAQLEESLSANGGKGKGALERLQQVQANIVVVKAEVDRRDAGGAIEVPAAEETKTKPVNIRKILDKYKELMDQAARSRQGRTVNTRSLRNIILEETEGRTDNQLLVLARSLYDQAIAKRNILGIKTQNRNWEAAAQLNDSILSWLRRNDNQDLRRLYDAIEAAYQEKVQEFVDTRIAPRAFVIDLFDVIPLDIYMDMVREGLVGTQFKQIDGGVGLSTKAWLRVNFSVSEVSSGVTLGALNVLGSLGPDPLETPVENPKADAKRHEVLVKLLHGEAIVNFSLTEPGAGSDNTGMLTKLVDGQLVGEKTFITVGTLLPYDYEAILVLPETITDISQIDPSLRSHWQQLGDDLILWNELRRQVAQNRELYRDLEHWDVVASWPADMSRAKLQKGESPYEIIRAFLVQIKANGDLPVREGKNLTFLAPKGGQVETTKQDPQGHRGSGTTQKKYSGIPINLDEDTIGNLKTFFVTLSKGRFTISAHAIGMIRGLKQSLSALVAHIEAQPQAENLSAQLQVARQTIEEIEDLDLLYTELLERGADLKDAGEDITFSAALAKIFLPEASTRLTQTAVDVVASFGYAEGNTIPDAIAPFSRVFDYAAMRFRDAKLLEIGEGTTEIQQKIINGTLFRPVEGTEYGAELAQLKSAGSDLAGAIAQLIELRNKVMTQYRLHAKDVVRSATEEGQETVLVRDAVTGKLAHLEGRVQILMSGYKRLSGLQKSNVDTRLVERALRWYLNDTLDWLSSQSFGELPPAETLALMTDTVELQRLRVAADAALVSSISRDELFEYLTELYEVRAENFEAEEFKTLSYAGLRREGNTVIIPLIDTRRQLAELRVRYDLANETITGVSFYRAGVEGPEFHPIWTFFDEKGLRNANIRQRNWPAGSVLNIRFDRTSKTWMLIVKDESFAAFSDQAVKEFAGLKFEILPQSQAAERLEGDTAMTAEEIAEQKGDFEMRRRAFFAAADPLFDQRLKEADGVVRKEDLRGILEDIDGLWADLIQKGLILSFYDAGQGTLLGRFKKLETAAGMQLDRFQSQEDAIFEVLQRIKAEAQEKSTRVIEDIVAYYRELPDSGLPRQFMYEYVQEHPSAAAADAIAQLDPQVLYWNGVVPYLVRIALGISKQGNPHSAARQLKEIVERNTFGGLPLRQGVVFVETYQEGGESKERLVRAEDRKEGRKYRDLLNDLPTGEHLDVIEAARQSWVEHGERLEGLVQKVPIPEFPEVPEGVQPGKLIAIRHGATTWSTDFLNKWAGWLNAMIVQLGLDAGQQSGEALNGQIEIDVAHETTLLRSQNTLDAFLEGFGKKREDISIRRTSDIAERNYGLLAGWRRSLVEKLFGSTMYWGWRREGIRPPGGEDIPDVQERAVPYYVEHILADIAAGKNVLVSGHNNGLRAPFAYLLESPLGEKLGFGRPLEGSEAKRLSFPLGGMTAVIFDQGLNIDVIGFKDPDAPGEPLWAKAETLDDIVAFVRQEDAAFLAEELFTAGLAPATSIEGLGDYIHITSLDYDDLDEAARRRWREHERLVHIRDDRLGYDAFVGIHRPLLHPPQTRARLVNGYWKAHENDDLWLRFVWTMRKMFFGQWTLGGTSAKGTSSQGYPTIGSVQAEGLSLGEGMANKAALSVPFFGGGKVALRVRNFDPAKKENKKAKQDILRALARVLNQLQIILTAVDSNVELDDVIEMAKTGPYTMIGSPEIPYGGAVATPQTARGVILGMRAAVELIFKRAPTLEGKTVALQGAGGVGREVLHALLEEEKVAQIFVSEIKPDNLEYMRRTFASEIAEGRLVILEDPDLIYHQQVDIFSPNASLRYILNENTIQSLAKAGVKIVAGAANNQLDNLERDGRALHEAGILYVPDYVINSGGLRAVEIDIVGFSLEKNIEEIYGVVREILSRAILENVPTYQMAERVARERMDAVASQIASDRTPQIRAEMKMLAKGPDVADDDIRSLVGSDAAFWQTEIQRRKELLEAVEVHARALNDQSFQQAFAEISQMTRRYESALQEMGDLAMIGMDVAIAPGFEQAVAQAQRTFMETGQLPVVNEGPVGGIDFNKLNLQIERDGNGVPLPVNLQDLEKIQAGFQGFLPVIIDVVPVNLPLLLGLEDQPEDRKTTKDGRGKEEPGMPVGDLSSVSRRPSSVSRIPLEQYAGKD